MRVNTYNYSTQEPEAGGLPQVWSHSGLLSKLHPARDIGRPYLKTKTSQSDKACLKPQRLRGGGKKDHEFKAILSHRTRSRPAWVTWNSVSKLVALLVGWFLKLYPNVPLVPETLLLVPRNTDLLGIEVMPVTSIEEAKDLIPGQPHLHTETVLQKQQKHSNRITSGCSSVPPWS